MFCLIVVVFGAVAVSGCGSEEASSRARRAGEAVASSAPSLGRLGLLRPELARTAAAVRTRWRRHGDPTTLAGVPKRFGPARIALATGTTSTRLTLYLYDSAREATHIRSVLRRGRYETGPTKTAGFCLYVGASDLVTSRFHRLFDIAEGRRTPA